MPETIVWPVSSLSFQLNVGSCFESFCSVSESFFRSAEVSGSTDMLMTVSGKLIDSKSTGCFGSQSVSPVCTSRGPTTPTISPASTNSASIFVLRSDWICQRCVTNSSLPVRGLSIRLLGLSLPE